MIYIHETFVCKPGNASKVAKLFKEVMADMPETTRILTDMTGQFHRVMVVSEYESLAAYEESWKKYMADTEETKKMNEKMKGFNDMYVSGSREIYRVW